MMTNDDLLSKLEQWLATRTEPPTLRDVLETRDRELAAAFILKAFRAAARKAVLDRFELEATTTFDAKATRVASALMRVFDGFAAAWALADEEKLVLLGLDEPSKLEALRATRLDEVSTGIIERVAILLDIFKAINTLLPEPNRADAWIRSPNSASMFSGQSALDVMLGRDLEGLREVRAYLNAQVWGA